MTAADRQELRELVEAYALAADRRDGAAAAALFAPDCTMSIHLDPTSTEPTSVRRGRDEIAAAMELLARWEATHHSISAAEFAIDGDLASGETTCVAHHFTAGRDEVLFIRYAEDLVRLDGGWRFAHRDLRVIQRAVWPLAPEPSADLALSSLQDPPKPQAQTT